MQTLPKLPKRARRVAEYVTELIENETLAPGTRLPSERELAEQFSMGHITVRRGLSALVDIGLIERRVGCGTYVADAQTRPTEATTVAIALPESALEMPTAVMALQGTREVLSQSRYRIEILGFDDLDMRFVDLLASRDVRGVIVQGYLLAPGAQRLAELSISVVSVGASREDNAPIHVWNDYDQLLVDAIRGAQDFGHREFAMLAWTEWIDPAERRPSAQYTRACLETGANSSADRQLLFYPPSPAGLPTCGDLPAFIDKHRVTCLIVADEIMAAAAMRNLMAADIRIPDDVSIVALMDCTPQIHTIPLSAPQGPVEIPRRYQIAATLLEKCINGEAVAASHRFAPAIEFKTSLGPVPQQ